MLKVLVSILFSLSVASVAMAQDPVKVDPNHYKVEFETPKCACCALRWAQGRSRSCIGIRML